MIDSLQSQFRIKFPGFGDIVIRPFILDDDVPVIHDWFNRDYACFRKMQGKSLHHVREKYQRLLAQSEYEVLAGILSSTGQTIFFVECYKPEDDSIGKYYDAKASDRGFHIIMAPPERSISGFTFFVMSAIAEYMFRDPSVRRIVAEPDIRNEKVLIRFAQAGYRLAKVVQLPSKTAQLVVLTRKRFSEIDRLSPPQKKRLPFRRLRLQYHLFFGRALSKLGRFVFRSN